MGKLEQCMDTLSDVTCWGLDCLKVEIVYRRHPDHGRWMWRASTTSCGDGTKASAWGDTLEGAMDRLPYELSNRMLEIGTDLNKRSNHILERMKAKTKECP